MRRDLTLDDVSLIIKMIRGALSGIEDPAARATAANRALTLALHGVVPSTGRD